MLALTDLPRGWRHFHFEHQALPELDLAEIDTSIPLFDKVVSAPILVSSMTGGTDEAYQINHNLALAAQNCGLAMGVGSQRAAIISGETSSTFRVRDVAPDILLFANIGAVQLNYGFTIDDCQRAVEMIEADALILHLNPLQEVFQIDGDVNWHGLLDKIAETSASHYLFPSLSKEVGWGISGRVARIC